jgi:hypothetical protein
VVVSARPARNRSGENPSEICGALREKLISKTSVLQYVLQPARSLILRQREGDLEEGIQQLCSWLAATHVTRSDRLCMELRNALNEHIRQLR